MNIKQLSFVRDRTKGGSSKTLRFVRKPPNAPTDIDEDKTSGDEERKKPQAIARKDGKSKDYIDPRNYF